ncbi:MAG: hypothetical protein WCF04_13325 [Candidatus Nanopelagicales bacterium]
MKSDLTNALWTKYPLIFPQRVGFSCNDGWYNLIDVLCERVQARVDAGNCEQVEATQVKEKYGGLRFYCDGADNAVLAFIDFAEAMSERMCEICGAPGAPNNTGWIQTLCDAHRAEQ